LGAAQKQYEQRKENYDTDISELSEKLPEKER
jgi:hypothetical protein